jgi:hypothetical protein
MCDPGDEQYVLCWPQFGDVVSPRLYEQECELEERITEISNTCHGSELCVTNDFG